MFKLLFAGLAADQRFELSYSMSEFNQIRFVFPGPALHHRTFKHILTHSFVKAKSPCPGSPLFNCL